MPNQEGEHTTSSASTQNITSLEGEAVKDLALVSEGVTGEQMELTSEGDNEYISLMLQPNLPDLDALSCKRNTRVPKTQGNALNSNDVSVRIMFSLATASQPNNVWHL